MTENPEFAALDPDLLDRAEDSRVQYSEYGRIIIPNKNELIETTRRMDKDQRRVVDIAVKYAKNIRKARKRGKRCSNPPHTMVHGAAGTG